MASLERTSRSVTVLMDELRRGELGLPEIQRSYVWNRPQARDLVDSLYKDYPTGVILLWKPEELPQLREGSFEQQENGHLSFLVLDGQQRLTSLRRVLDGQIDVYFNVKDETFQIYSRKLQGDAHWVSVQKVLQDGALA